MNRDKVIDLVVQFGNSCIELGYTQGEGNTDDSKVQNLWNQIIEELYNEHSTSSGTSKG